MRRLRPILLAGFVAVLLGAFAPAHRVDAQGAVATGDAAWRLLQQGGSVALIRHGRTSGGAGDPQGFKLEDCATQRNLTEEGRAQMRKLAEQVRTRGVVATAVLSSRWCRCLETARLVFGKAEPWPQLDNLYGNSAGVAAQTAELRKRIRAWTGPGTLVLSTHGANILPLTGIQPAEGEMVIVAPDAKDDFRVVGRIAPQG